MKQEKDIVWTLEEIEELIYNQLHEDEINSLILKLWNGKDQS